MQVLPALEVKNKFGKFSTIVDRGEIVTVTKHGEPTMVVLPVRFAQEIQKALRRYYVTEKVNVSDGILEWLVELPLSGEADTPAPAFDEAAEKQKIREMIAKELGIPVPKPSTKAEALAAFDRYDDKALKALKNKKPSMTDEEETEFMRLVDEAREEVWQEQQAENAKLPVSASH